MGSEDTDHGESLASSRLTVGENTDVMPVESRSENRFYFDKNFL